MGDRLQEAGPFRFLLSRLHWPRGARRRGGLGSILIAGAQGQKEKAAEAASVYVIDIPTVGASLHSSPTDHTDRAYRRRPELSNPDGRAIHRRRSVRHLPP